MVLGTRWKVYDVQMKVRVDDCIGASDDQLRSYIDYKLGLSVSKFKPLLIEDLKLNRVYDESGDV